MKYYHPPHQRRLKWDRQPVILSDILAAVGLVVLLAVLIGIAGWNYRLVGV